MSVPAEWKKGGLSYSSGLTLEITQKMLKAAEKEADKLEVPMSIAVCDSGGNLVAFIHMDNAMLCSIQIALDKAYTAVYGKQPTFFWGKTKPGEVKPAFFHERWITFPGGFPIIKDGILYGGIGASGGSGFEDGSVVYAALKAGSFDTQNVLAFLSEIKE